MCVSQTEHATIFCPDLFPVPLLTVGSLSFLKKAKPAQTSNIITINLIIDQDENEKPKFYRKNQSL